MMLRRFIAVAAAAGLLAVGVAACGKSPMQSAAASEPGSSTSTGPSTAPGSARPPWMPPPPETPGPPDLNSCNQAKSLANTTNERLIIVRRAMAVAEDRNYSLSLTNDTVRRAAEAAPLVADSQVKAVVEEYRTGLVQLKQQLEGYRGDRYKILTDIDATTTKLGTASQSLTTLCADATVQHSAAARAATCQKVNESGQRLLLGPMMEINAAGNDAAKLKDAVNKFNAALDAYAADLVKYAGETGDSELRPAMLTAMADTKRMRQAIAPVATDAKKLEALLRSDSFHTGQNQLLAICGS